MAQRMIHALRTRIGKEAHAQAVKAQLELAKFKAPRSLDKERLSTSAIPFAKTNFSAAVIGSDPEAIATGIHPAGHLELCTTCLGDQI
jgi:hypothetical protein